MTSSSSAVDPAASRASSPAPGMAPLDDIGVVVQGLERELAARKRRRWVRLLVTFLGAGVLFVGFGYYRRANAPPPEPQFTTSPVEVRDVVEEVQSTGVVEPVNQVDIGAQVSGRIVTVDVDFNDRVQAGQMLAQIDPEILGAEVTQQSAQLVAAQASVKSAEARRDAVKTRVERLKLLVAENVAGFTDLENAQGEYDVAVAEVGTAQAQIAQIRARLSSARATLGYAKIFSPIDGVVIDRQVEPGQTVASSFNTPVLFVIAKDLEQMRVLAEIDEADVGKVKEGMLAKVTVDAFPDSKFEGKLTQIRLSPNTVEGVVTYSAVILVENEGGKLRPGMTATATVVTQEARGVKAVRNSALRFEPLPPPAKPGEEKKPQLEDEKSKLPRPGPGQGRLYLQGNGPVENPGSTPVTVEVGISDGVWTELKTALPENSKIIVDEKPSGEKKGFRLF